MRFLITMNMPSYSGNAVHQIQAEHSSKSLEEFADALMQNDFVIVEEFYRDQNTKEDYSRGFMAINHQYVGKIKVMNTDPASYRKE